MKNPVHPGEILREGVLADLRLGVGEAAARRPGSRPGASPSPGVPAWRSWVLIDEVDGPWIYFRQIDSREAAAHGELVVAAS